LPGAENLQGDLLNELAVRRALIGDGHVHRRLSAART